MLVPLTSPKPTLALNPRQAISYPYLDFIEQYRRNLAESIQ